MTERIKPFPQTRRENLQDFCPESAALLVVDMQYFDAHRDWGYGRTASILGVEDALETYFAAIDEITPRIRRILDLARSKGLECIHLRVAEVSHDSRDVGYKQLVRGLVVPPRSKEAEFLPTLEPAFDEIVVSKSSSGVFPATNLDRLLRNMGVSTLIFTGTVTGGCVESAVHDATDLGYRVILVDDACADTTSEAHRLAIARMKGGSTSVISSEDLLQKLTHMRRINRYEKSGISRVKPYLPDEKKVPKESPKPTAYIFPPAVDLQLDPEDTVLILQDFQRLFCDCEIGWSATLEDPEDIVSAEFYYDEVKVAQSNAKRLLEICREHSILPIHIRTAALTSDGRDLSPHLQACGLSVNVGDREAEFAEHVDPGSDEVVLNKPGRSGFNGTGLDELLRNIGAKNIVLAGASPDGALDATIRSAGDRGYGVFLIPEACAVTHPLLRDRLENMESGIINLGSIQSLMDILGK